jgi:hypothetical protein
MHRIGSWWLLGLCLLLPALASTAELEHVEGQVLVDVGNGFSAAGPGRLAPGDRVILLEQARVTIAYGDCQVHIESPTVYTVTATPPCASGEATLSIPGGASAAGSTVDSASLSGFVWRDLNDNSSWERAENKLGGIEIALVNESCQVGVDCLVATTDSDGNYGFASVVPGTYSVTVMGEDDEDRTVVAVIILGSGEAYTLDIGLGSSGFVAAARGLAVAGSAAAVGSAATGGTTAAGSAGVGSAVIVGGGLAFGAMAFSVDSNGKRLSP